MQNLISDCGLWMVRGGKWQPGETGKLRTEPHLGRTQIGQPARALLMVGSLTPSF